MTLEEALKISDEVEVSCISGACGARTRLDIRFFANRRGLSTRLDELALKLVCAACGGDVVVGLPTG